MANDNIHIFSNNIPPPDGQKAERVVQEGIGNRLGPWTVTLSEPPESGRFWNVTVKGPHDESQSFRFDWHQQEDPVFIAKTIDNWLLALGIQRPS